MVGGSGSLFDALREHGQNQTGEGNVMEAETMGVNILTEEREGDGKAVSTKKINEGARDYEVVIFSVSHDEVERTAEGA